MITSKSDISVTIKNILDNTEYTIISDVNGLASFNVPSGTYEVLPSLSADLAFKSDSEYNIILDNTLNPSVTTLPYLVHVSNDHDSIAVIIVEATGTIIPIDVNLIFKTVPNGENQYIHSWQASLIAPIDHDITIVISSYVVLFPNVTDFTLTIPTGSILSNESIWGFTVAINNSYIRVKLKEATIPSTTNVMVNTSDILNINTYTALT